MDIETYSLSWTLEEVTDSLDTNFFHRYLYSDMVQPPILDGLYSKVISKSFED